jgi:hypothetical protein
MTQAHNLNQGQKAAAEAFFEFLFAPEKEFIISGAAGVGKTFLMSHIIDIILPRYAETCKLVGLEPTYTGVTMTATTNKAAEVLAQATRRPTQTIHSFLNLKVFEDYTTGKTRISKTDRWTVHQNMIVFIDECSMIDTPLYKHIQEGFLNCKIVYVGDHNQLAPVQEKLSPVYRQNAPFYELKEPMRNVGQPALMEICEQLRETVATGVFKPIQTVPGAIQMLSDQGMQDAIDYYFRQSQDPDAKILAYTNKRVIDYNDHIRGIRNLPVEYQVGEQLVNNAVYKTDRKSIAVEAELTVVRNSGSDFILVDNLPNGDVIKLAVSRLDIANKLGNIFLDVPVPLDRDHYNALIKYYSSVKNWEKYYMLKQEVMDLRPRDAATVHKSQGSTYDTVFIDLGNISTCHQMDQAARMLYVAFSRARSRVYLYGNLAQKYGGVIL